MSSLEPPTTAKVVLITSKGPIEIELWAKEIPQITKQFIQNCLDKKYIGTSFNKVIKDYLVQTGKVNGPESFNSRDEFHSRLKFSKRGLIGAIHNQKRNSNSVDSFFITLKPTPEFNNDYVLFGKITGETIYNVIKINESEMVSEETPMFPATITDIEIPIRYFDDLVEPRDHAAEPTKKKSKKSNKTKVKLDYDLEDEPEKEFKMKSAHELLQDKKLSNKLYIDKRPKDVSSSIPSKEEQAKYSVDESSNDAGDVHTDTTPNTNAESNSIINDETSNINEIDEEPSQATNKDVPRITTRAIRNPNIDSDYDSDLDLSAAESIDL